MGQFAKRNNQDQSAQGGSGQGVWLESCTVCAAPVTLFGAKPLRGTVRCATCAAAAPPPDEQVAADDGAPRPASDVTPPA